MPRRTKVWAWLVQIGQGRGGLYSYDALENLIRCDIHSADQIIRELQDLHPGDLILLAPAGAPCFWVAGAEPPRVLTLVGADPKTRTVGPILATPEEMASTWQWLLHSVNSGRGTRLMVRQRYSYPRRQSVMWHLTLAAAVRRHFTTPQGRLPITAGEIGMRRIAAIPVTGYRAPGRLSGAPRPVGHARRWTSLWLAVAPSAGLGRV
jgi:hypothetical protein